MRRRRTIAAGAAGALAVACLATAGVLTYVRAQVLDRAAFERHAVEAIQRPMVRRAVADRVVAEIISRGEPDLVTARPLLETAVASVIASAPFAAVLRIAAGDVHRVLFARRRDEARLQVADLAGLVISAVRSVDPDLARQLPRSLDVRLASLTVDDLSAGAPRIADDVRGAAPWLLGAGLALLAASLALARDRARGVVWLGTGTVGAAVVVLVLAGARPRAGGQLGQLSRAETDAAFAQAWWAFAGGLRAWTLAIASAALLTVLVTSWRAPLPAGWRVRLGHSLLAPRASRHGRAARAAIALAIAGGLVAASTRAGQAVGIGLATVLALLALDELLGRREPRARRRAASTRREASRRVAIVAAVVIAAAGLGAGVLHLTEESRELPLGAEGPGAESTRPAEGCNGALAPCRRRLNEVMFPGTHNSMSAIGHPGWVFTNQRHDIARQLRDGVRLLLLDPHWGRRDGARVRTDLAREGSSRNRAARVLGSRGILTAERLAGGIGLGGPSGADEVFLCHTLCELGATPMSDALDAVREFLDEHPREVIVILLESSVPGSAIEQQFEAARLVSRTVALERDVPLPTLGELLQRRQQLVVFGDHDTGGVPWYLDAGTFIQDTPVDARTCTRRTGHDSSPFLLVNHWIDSFPPRPSLARSVGTRARLETRVRACTQARGLPVSLIAVDYYERTSVIEIAADRNAVP